MTNTSRIRERTPDDNGDVFGGVVDVDDDVLGGTLDDVDVSGRVVGGSKIDLQEWDIERVSKV